MRIVKTPNTRKENRYIISITGDSNDDDCITLETHLSDEAFNDTILALKFLLDNCIGYHKLEEYYDNDELCAEIDIDEYLDIPYGEMGPCHTITAVDIMYYEKSGMSYVVTLEDGD